MNAARPLLPAHKITYCTDATDAATGADAVLVLTEWNEFRAVSAKDLRKSMRGDVVIDLRNIWDPASMAEAGFVYSSIGRPKRRAGPELSVAVA
jgi:UDPglucose 6-dehydrogenase